MTKETAHALWNAACLASSEAGDALHYTDSALRKATAAKSAADALRASIEKIVREDREVQAP